MGPYKYCLPRLVISDRFLMTFKIYVREIIRLQFQFQSQNSGSVLKVIALFKLN